MLTLDSARTMDGVFERAAAHDPLQPAMAQERHRRRQLERELCDARAELARLRVELAGTEASAQRARHDALHDGLTALPNRRYFRERLELAVAQAHAEHATAAVLYIDLDGFKSINDVLGHDRGDELLRIVAARLSHAVRAADLVSRIGGDEFACLPADVLDEPQLRHLAAKLFDAVSAPVTLAELRLCIYPSIGIASYPAGGNSADALLRSADTAMYRAKRARSRYAFFDRLASIARPLP
ncbi:MAG TPA: GGDEF domain-containing protein [Ideonella sp.]|nr:GGDEF domain-containing protein [Ideonella sp.]